MPTPTTAAPPPASDAPVYCHQAERQAAESDESFRPYWELAKLAAYARPVYRRLIAHWDGGAVPIAGTLAEGDEVAGFRVIELPGHAPGLIGLIRESDGLALVSDCFYTVDPQTGRKNAAHVPHPAFNQDTEQARAVDPQARGAASARGLARPRRPGHRRRHRAARARGQRPRPDRVVGRRNRQREKHDRLAAPVTDYTDSEGNVLRLRGSLSPAHPA